MTEKHAIKFDENFFNKLGQLGSILSVMMYVSYIPQILDNLAGHKGNFIQPAVAALNCCLWCYYGFFKGGKYPWDYFRNYNCIDSFNLKI